MPEQIDAVDEMKARKRPPIIKTERNTTDSGGGAAAVEQEEEPMSPAGRVFHQKSFNCCIIAKMGVGTPIDIDVVQSGLEATLVRHPRFSSIAILDESGGKKAKWVRTEVTVRDHMVIPDLDPDKTSSSPDEQVEDYVSSLTKTPMDLSRPLWELHILNFPTSDAAAVAVFRIHHSLGDGVSLVSLLLACTRKASDSNSLPTLPQARRRPAAQLKLGLFTIFLFIRAFLILAWNTLVDLFHFTATFMFLKDTLTPLKGTEGIGFRPKRFVHRTVSLDDIKYIKDAMQCTVNDVILGVTSAGLSRYLSRKYGENEDLQKQQHQQLPANIRLRSTVLVNVRPSPGIHALSEMMEGKNSGAKWGNLIAYIILPFPIVKHKDPLDYIWWGKAIADRKKNSLEAILVHWTAEMIVKICGLKTAALLCNKALCNTTFSFSNVVGPVEEIEFYGHPIVYLAPSVYGHPHALTMHYQSYMNKMTIALAVDDITIPDPHQLLDDLAESLKLIKETLPSKS